MLFYDRLQPSSQSSALVWRVSAAFHCLLLDLNLISWSGSNLLAVPLGCRMYIWNASTGDIAQLMELPDSEYICSASWVKEGSYLAVGTSSGEVQV